MFWNKKSNKIEGTLTLGKIVSDKIDKMYDQIAEYKEQEKNNEASAKNNQKFYNQANEKK